MPILIPCPRCSGTGTDTHEDGQVLGDEPDGPSDYAGKIEAFFDEAARAGLGVEAMRAYLAEELRILNDAALHRGACGGASAGSFDPVSGRAFGDPAHPSS